MGKCIILSRVSTERQTLEQQTDLLIKKAKSDGYKDDEIIVIENKESAIKKSADERVGLQKLKNEISKNDEIKIVYIYEISRLGRRMDVLIEMRDFFVSNQIQLYIYNNNQYLLEKKDDKLVLSYVGGVIFTLFSQFAESEMKDKKDRMKRGKIAKRNDLKYIGGKIPFGYKVNKNNNNIIEEDEKNAEIVRKIFNDYEKGLSMGSIGKTLMLRGEIPSKHIKSARMFISLIINRIQYTGADVGSYVLPQIISKEQFKKCQEIAKNQRKPKSNIKNIYWCKNLIYTIDSMTGKERMLSPEVGTCIYRYFNMENNESISVNINMVDSITWHVVKTHRIESSSYDANKEAEEAQIILDDAQKKLANCDNRIADLNKEKERWLQMFIKGRINEDRLDKEEYKIQIEIGNIDIEKEKYNHIITEMMNRIIYATSWFYEKNINEEKSDEEIFDIIHNDLDKILISKGDKNFKYKLIYHFKNGFINKYDICTNVFKKYLKNDKGEEVEFEYIERFKRKQH